MEAATLNSPPCRNIIVSPIQKSLSLPSYAKAGGEGIDHRIIFAALEQKERVRRKSRIFAKEKKQNNLFCLPIKSNNKCRETSLSSDTSCSSLEYQKPTKGKKEEVKWGVKDGKTVNGLTKLVPTVEKPLEVDPKYDFASDYNQDNTTKLVLNGNDENPNRIKVTVNIESTTSIYHQQFHSNAVDDKNRSLLRMAKGLQEGIYRSGIGSSGDSMERSSRSSSDSLSRKERMVALKARVEAQREKYGAGSSSEDELPRNGQRITRYNSDDVIHRTVREVKSKSSRMEKRMRRRSQDEWALKRAARKQNISLYISPGEDIFGSYRDKAEPECKTDFCPSPQFPDLMKKNYFSDFPTRENVTRFVQARIKCIENEEMKRRNSIDKLAKPVRQCTEKDNQNQPLNQLQNNDSSHSHNKWDNLNSDMCKPSLSKTVNPPSPTPKSPKAPTPPPRSPKSLTFVNKAFLQHHNTSHARPENRSMERKPLFEANIRSVNKSTPATAEDSPAVSDAVEKRKIRELISSRRKTCSNFSFIQDMSFDNSTSSNNCSENNKQSVLNHEDLLQKFHNGKSIETKGYAVNSENMTSAESKVNMLKNKWNEMEQRREMQFNSLESNVNALSAFLNKRKDEPVKHGTCLCSGMSEGKRNCFCPSKGKEYFFGYENQFKMPENKYYRPALNPPIKSNPSNRLSKSEANIAAVIQPKIRPYNSRVEAVVSPTRYTEKISPRSNEKQSQHLATANLESAMEELESVYQSLKFSSDNLSDKNSLSNASEEDNQNNHKSFEIKLNLNETSLNSNADDLVAKDSILYSKINETSNELKSTPLSNASIIASSPKSSISESLCIDELFNDLTRQLDFEQKLLKESRDPKVLPQSTSNLRSALEDRTYQKHTSPLDSIVSIRKELYDNLYQNVEKSKDATVLKTNETDLAKKKYKAVRSLSANISHLMKTDSTNSGMQSSLKSDEQFHDETRKNTPLHDNRHPDHPYVRNFSHSPLVIERSRCEKGPDNNSYPFGSEAISKNSPYLNQSPKEIRQIRVSMDNSPSKPKPIQTSPNQSFSRLTSAVCQPQDKTHLSKLSESDLSWDIHKKSTTVNTLDEAALEDLLKSLLTEVSHKREDNSFPIVQTVASNPVTLPAGEMLVMQHLDVLRLKPMLS